eukprot:CAMPEP_0179041138 /NCGR_PEP_ID=MMETSP0796-20121207/16003_1 /TAXON_ID=73915 /ORGANISM="Pyrodinium bahamense, Strain pbaha01" /LENGTH=154 /DNA_ID=CAMNT_0020737495 /DNA_START=80 /DNA_END=542 /DNA_ORIENTATION=+
MYPPTEHFSLAGLEEDVKLCAVRAPLPEVVVAHLATDGGVLILLFVDFEVRRGEEVLVETQGLARVCDDGLNSGLRRDAHAGPHACGRVCHENLADLRRPRCNARLATLPRLDADEHRGKRPVQQPEGRCAGGQGAETRAAAAMATDEEEGLEL